jgi:hypothetical protein
MTPFFHTETDESRWSDCTVASGIMAGNKATNNHIPNTRAEREALRASVPSNGRPGFNLWQLEAAMRKRYGFTLPGIQSGLYLSFDQFKDRLANGYGAVIQGLYAYLGSTYGTADATLTRWDRAFAMKGRNSGHAMYADRYNPKTDSFFVMDPLGRGTDRRTGEPYSGEWMPAKAIYNFMRALANGGHLYFALAKEGEHAPAAPKPAPKPVPKPVPAKEPEMKFVSASGYGLTSKTKVRVKAGTEVLYLDGKTHMTSAAPRNKGDKTVDLITVGLGDAHADQHVVLVNSAAPFKDGKVRPVMGLVKTGEVIPA